jgi:hypothetical protein
MDNLKDATQSDEDKYELDNREPPDGYIAIEPKPNELFIDIDHPESFKIYNFYKPKIDQMYGRFLEDKLTQSKTEGHYHIILKLPYDTEVMERLFLQRLLGSDPLREYLSYRRVIEGIEMPILFFEKEEV